MPPEKKGARTTLEDGKLSDIPTSPMDIDRSKN
jgi:hypothetical protein